MIATKHIRATEIFSDLPEATLERVAALAKLEIFAMGEIVAEAGEPAERMYILQSGALQLMAEPRGRFSYVPEPVGYMEIREPGELIGWSSLVPPYLYTLTGLATKETTLVSIDGRALKALMDADHDLGYEIMKGVARVMRSRLDRKYTP